MRRATQVAVIGAALIGMGPGPAEAQEVQRDFYVTDGTVNTVVEAGGVIYLGGLFTQVQRQTGGGALLYTTLGAALGAPEVVGRVFAVAPDGAGGWYIGGFFTSVGGISRQNLAHIRTDYSVSGWNPSANNQGVYALAVSGGVVYAGGDFTTVGGQMRNKIAALDATTGTASAWNPNANNDVRALVASGSTIYVGGQFTGIGGQGRSRIAALDATTGLATAWNPAATGGPQGVWALLVSGSTIYVGGDFDDIGGQSRSKIAALDRTTGLATSWNPNASGAGGFQVQSLAVVGGTVYAAGRFTDIGGQARSNIAALDAATGLATAWNPRAPGAVNALAVSGATIYAGGEFDSIGGQARSRIAALDATTGLATDWNPCVNGNVSALGSADDRIYAGGEFTAVGKTRNNVAALNATTGTPTDWDPNASDEVFSLAASGSTIYVGGAFMSIGGQSRNRIAALDATTALATTWNPDPGGGSEVRALVVSGNKIYVSGGFSSIGGQSRNKIAALDRTTGLATSWNPNPSGGPPDAVLPLAVVGGTVYAAGGFHNIGGQVRSNIAALDAATGLATAWNPSADGRVNALAVSGSTVYVGGEFTSIGGQTRNRIAALDAATGVATGWNPNANNFVNALALRGGLVYAGGPFTSIGGQTRNRIAALAAGTGLATAWNPNANGTLTALAVSEGAVYAGGAFTIIGGLSQASFAAIAVVPEISAVQPASGGNAGAMAVALSGNGFRNGATIKLARAAQPDIPGTGVTAAADGQSMAATFDLTGAALGSWDLVVTNPDLQTATLPNGFTIEAPTPRQIRVDVLGPALMRPNRRRAFDIVLENLGNLDELAVPLWISRIPLDATVDLDFGLASPPQDGGEPDWSTVPLTLTGPGGRYLALVIPHVPPGITVRRIYVTVPNTVSGFQLDAALTPPWADGVVFRDCLSNGGVITAPACMGAQLTAINAYLAATPGIEALSGIGLWAKIAWQCEGAASLPTALTKAEQVLDYMLQPIEHTSIPSGCEVTLVPRWQDSLAVTVVTSVDPNDKLGAGGRGSTRDIGSEQLLPYSIRFENLETATAPAQEVVVIDALDGATLDLSTVIVSEIKFGRRANGLPWTIEPPPGLISFTTDVDLRPERQLIARVGVNVDRATGMMGWSLRSIDPATGEPPENPLEGFLPPNFTPPEGEGSLLFTVRPKPGIIGGAQIQNRATINFDGIATQTPYWSNTIDITPPESAVQPLSANQDSARFTVRWASVGSQPDLRDYSIYVSEDGGAYRPWRVQTTATADTLVTAPGRQYRFYSLARDSSGNLEDVPGSPDGTTQVASPALAVGSGAWTLALEGAVPNPTTTAPRVWFTLPSRERAVLEVMDIAGRRLLRHDVGTMGPGRHSVDVSTAARRSGLYFLRLAQGGRTLNARMVVVR